MAKEIKSLAKDTAIYGMSSIVGKFLNWLLTPFYTFVLVKQADMGSVTELYAWSAFLIVLLTYGMETGFFRYANKQGEDANKVYGNTLISIGFTTFLFALLIVFFNQPIASFLNYNNNPEFIWLLGLTVALDSFASIPFAYLRFIKRPIVFASLKLLYVGLNIAFNLFFFLLCPWLMKVAPDSVSWFYNPNYGVGYVFVANFIATVLQTLVLLRYVFAAKFQFDWKLLKQILNYSYPLLFLGIAGIANQNLDKILFPFLQVGEVGKADLGVYGAVGKIAMVIMMFTQAFRYAYEPFVFAKHKDKNSLAVYSDAMKFFVIFSLLIFLGMVLYMDLIKFILEPSYWKGLDVVQIILWSFIFQGVYFNLSIWYKLKDKNHYGAWFAVAGTVIIFIGNILFVPKYSYWGSAWSAFVGYFVVMLLSYFFGQKHMPINYQLKKLGGYLLLTLFIFGASKILTVSNIWLNFLINTALFSIFIVYVLKKDFPISQIPYLNKRFIKKNK